ncbi:MAG: HD-GYP domain-containing protein (c-di-GMP phosphodiesterase class II) [Flavobacteriales bacterium]|jgi:HD-GYP domain-containing protein (c-di-GMP phosphodiesterase class II)
MSSGMSNSRVELDDETKKDLFEAFDDLNQEFEVSLNKLLRQWDDEQVHCLFRAIHNIKGNAGILQVSLVVEFTHEVEEVVGALRRKQFQLTDAIVETLLIAMDRLNDLHQQELYGRHFEHLRIDELKVLYHAMSLAENDEANGISLQILQFLGAGIVDANVDLFLDTKKEPVVHIEPLATGNPEDKRALDLVFFQELALQLDNQVEHWFGRSIQLFDWAMKMNRIAGSPVDSEQFAAAIYLHDIGMSLVPRECWHLKLDVNDDELDDIKRHPDWGYQYLVRIPGWEEAATIIYEHHERTDGSGYPRGLQGREIHAGAKILAILDAFFHLTNGAVDASARKSTVRAVSTINAHIDSEFEGLWVQCFNHMIRSELKAGNI